MALKLPLVLEDRQAEAPPPLDPRVLGERSYDAGFLKDAKRYFLIAHEQNPDRYRGRFEARLDE